MQGFYIKLQKPTSIGRNVADKAGHVRRVFNLISQITFNIEILRYNKLNKNGRSGEKVGTTDFTCDKSERQAISYL